MLAAPGRHVWKPMDGPSKPVLARNNVGLDGRWPAPAAKRTASPGCITTHGHRLLHGTSLGSLVAILPRFVTGQRIDLRREVAEHFLCRWGYMLMADPVAALRETR